LDWIGLDWIAVFNARKSVILHHDIGVVNNAGIWQCQSMSNVSTTTKTSEC